MSDPQNETRLTPMPSFEERVEKSTQVQSITYDPATKVLSVIFKRTPAIYDYQDFPPEKWAELQQAPSIGSWLYHNVTKGDPPPYRFNKTAIPENSLPKEQP